MAIQFKIVRLFVLVMLMSFGFLNFAESATQLLKTVMPSGGDYTSLEACMHANEQNLVTADKYLDVKIDGTWSSADTTAVTIHNYTTDATRYINIYTTTAARHLGLWSTSYYNLTLSSADGIVFNCNSQFVRLTGIQVKNTHTTASVYTRAFEFSVADTIVDKVIGIAVGGRALNITEINVGRIRNSVFLNNSSVTTCLFYGAWNNPTGNNIFNSICANLGSGNGLARDTYDITAKNVYAYSGSGTAFGTVGTLTTCASDDGSQSTTTVAYTTSTFVNVTADSENFHLVSGSGLIDVGTDLSATFTDDIDGVTRSGTWDIGADEFVAVGGARRVIFIN